MIPYDFSNTFPCKIQVVVLPSIGKGITFCYLRYSFQHLSCFFEKAGGIAMKVVIAHYKGGTGKTTTSVQLALWRQITRPKTHVWLIDTDEQKSALDTISFRSELDLKPSLACSAYSTAKELTSQLNAQGNLFDDIIIDSGGRDTDALRVALLAADVLLIPVLPRAYDIWSISRLEGLMESARNLGANFRAYAFINRRDKTADCRESIEFLKKDENLTYIDFSFSDRVAYAKAGGVGRSVLEMRPKDKKACEELDALAKFVFTKA